MAPRLTVKSGHIKKTSKVQDSSFSPQRKAGNKTVIGPKSFHYLFAKTPKIKQW